MASPAAIFTLCFLILPVLPGHLNTAAPPDIATQMVQRINEVDSLNL